MTAAVSPWLESLAALIGGHLLLAPILAFAAGILTSFLPCSLGSIPLVLGYVGGVGQKKPGRSFALSAVFVLGMSLSLTALGAAAALFGLLFSAGTWWYLLLGLLMVLMALQVWEVFQFIPATHAIAKSKKRGFAGAFLAGMLGGLFSSPCATPVLVVLLAYVAEEGTLLLGAALLFLYSLGHGVPVLIAGTSLAFIQKVAAGSQYGKVSAALRILLGAAILLLGVYMLSFAF